MSLRTTPWPNGVPCWADLTVPDVDVAVGFYTSVLGWSVERGGPEFGDYALATVRGSAAAAIGPKQQPDQPSAWTLYLASDDVEGVAAAVPGLGGTVLLPPGDVGPSGRLCIAADPSGAVFGVWQAGTHIGAGVVNEPGGMMWEDLRSTDPDAARAFYSGLFGYRTDPLPQAGPTYSTFARPDEEAPLGGMGGMMGAPDGTPSHWLVYFAVEDAAAAVAAAETAGGSVLMRDFVTPFGTMAGLADPAGAMFMVIQPRPDDPTPDRTG
jgi:predicted enzyme related to lactoylglutathione lyase